MSEFGVKAGMRFGDIEVTRDAAWVELSSRRRSGCWTVRFTYGESFKRRWGVAAFDFIRMFVEGRTPDNVGAYDQTSPAYFGFFHSCFFVKPKANEEGPQITLALRPSGALPVNRDIAMGHIARLLSFIGNVTEDRYIEWVKDKVLVNEKDQPRAKMFRAIIEESAALKVRIEAAKARGLRV